MKRSRTQILGINPCFTHHLLRVQTTRYRPEDSEPDAEAREEYNRGLDPNPFASRPVSEPSNSAALIARHSGATEYLSEIAAALEGLRLRLNQEHLLVLGDWPTPWLAQANDYPPVARALEYLAARVDAAFTGGFQLADSSLTEFIPHLFWLVRCNASLPEFHMAFTNSRTVISLCRYGSLHLNFYDPGEEREILKYLRKRAFSRVNACSNVIDFEVFDESGKRS